MANHNKEVKALVNLWHETQVGHYKKCQEKQFEFADLMWDLREEIYDPMTGWANGNVDTEDK